MLLAFMAFMRLFAFADASAGAAAAGISHGRLYGRIDDELASGFLAADDAIHVTGGHIVKAR